MPRALVTGAAGFIGRALCQRLLSLGWQVTGIDALHSESSREGLAQLKRLSPLDFDLQVLDLSQQRLALAPVDCVFHLAALPGVRSRLNYADYARHNLEATHRLLEWCLSSGSPALIFASSSSVYGNGSQQASRESDLLQPLSDYALSKVRAEKLLREAATQTPLKLLILRLFTVYGPGQRPDMVIRHFVEAISQQRVIQAHAPHLMQRDFTHLSDILQGFIQAAQRMYDLPPGLDCFNLGSGQPIRLSSLIQMLEQTLDRFADWQAVACGKGEAQHTWADIRLAQDFLNYQPCVTLKQGLTHYWQWYQSQSPRGNGHELSSNSEWTRQLV